MKQRDMRMLHLDDHPVPLGWKSALLLTLVSLIGLGMFAWPLLIPAAPDSSAPTTSAPFIFIVLLPLLVLLALAQLSEQGMDTKALAILGVLSAVNAALRPLGAGTNGIETVFFLLILAGRVFGPGFGFVLGCTSMFASALLTAGVGPWLPFQMLASGWIGLGAGLLPRRVRGKPEIAMLVGYGIVTAYLFGALMNMWFWPFLAGSTMGDEASLAFVAGGPLLDNLRRFGVYTLLTSTATWDTVRAVTNTVALLVVGPAVLGVLRRATTRANFAPDVRFERTDAAV
jgi:energy-coupling factor transport system substrate-specific component